MKRILNVISIVCVLCCLLSCSAMAFYPSAAESDALSSGSFTDYYRETGNATGSEVFGDVDFDGELKVKDATMIQKFLAQLVKFSSNQEILANVDGDDETTVKDASAIQKAVAKITGGVPVSRIYNWDLTEEKMDVSLVKSGQAKINFYAEKSGYYDFRVKNTLPDFIMSMPSETGAYNSQKRLWVYLSGGQSYEINVYNKGEKELNTSISFTYSEDFTLFDTKSALDTAAPVTVKAGSRSVLLKVKATSFTNTVNIKSQGEDPKISSVKVYDSSLSLVSDVELSYTGGGNIANTIPAYDYMSEYYYVHIINDAGCSEYSLTCAPVSDLVISEADSISLSVSKEVRGDYYEEETVNYTNLSGVYKFTPSYSGYYKFTITAPSYGNVRYGIYDEDALYYGLTQPVCAKECETEFGSLILTDVESLKANADYYIYITGKVYSDAKTILQVSNSTAAEYGEAHKNDAPNGKEQILSISKPLKIGEEAQVETAFEDDTKWYKFTATADMQVVIFSWDSADAFLIVLDKDFKEIGRFDDIRAFSTRDFAVLGKVKKGEVYYLGAGSYEADGDFYSIKLVNRADYKPLG